jgi:hypothetical protein
MPVRATIIQIMVGVPENPKKVNVDTSSTLADVMAEHINGQGVVQHNGSTIQNSRYNKTLDALGFVDGDTLFVVKKMSNA